jgi:DNA polymerase III subunit beta
MKFDVLREDFLNAVQKVQYSSNMRGMMPILSGIKLESNEKGIALHSTDLESYTVTECVANIIEGGTCVVSLKVFMEYLRESRDEKLEVELLGNEMVLKGQSTVFKLFTMPPEDFPNVPEVNIPVLEDLESRVFLNVVQKTAKAASRDEKRPTLMGILLEIGEEEIRMVSTDSYRLAIGMVKEGYKVLEEGQYIIPSAAMANLARIVEKDEKIKMYRDENKGQARFELKGSNHIIRLIEGKFPKYDQFIPENLEKLVETDKEEVLGALKRISLINTTVKMKIESDGITISSESSEVGEGKEKVAASYNGEETEIAFNAKFLEDGITCIDGEKIVLGITEPLKPGILKKTDGEDFVYIIMPIRL